MVVRSPQCRSPCAGGGRGEIGEIVAGLKPGRESDDERIVFWHKGIAVSDIVIGDLVYRKAKERGLGTMLSYYADPRDM